MTENKMAAPMLQHRNGQKARETFAKPRILIVPKIRAFVHNIIVGTGATGFGLIIGFGLPPLLGLTHFRPVPLVVSFTMIFVGCMEESACFVNGGGNDDV